jgi:hypothetical protein
METDSDDEEDSKEIEPVNDDNMKEFYEESYACCKIFVEFFLNRYLTP